MSPVYVLTNGNSYAAGPMTKFKRKYHQKVGNDLYNARSVGAAVAASVLVNLDPVSSYPMPGELELPTFEQPLAHGCMIAGMYRCCLLSVCVVCVYVNVKLYGCVGVVWLGGSGVACAFMQCIQ